LHIRDGSVKSGPDVLKTFGLILWMIPTKRELLKSDVLQLSGLLAGDVKESRNDNPIRDLQMAADRTGPHSLCGTVVSSLFSVAARC
jgi:hypothetical protein